MSNEQTPNSPTPAASNDEGQLSAEALDNVSGGLSIADIDFTKVIYQGSSGGSSSSAYGTGTKDYYAHESSHTVQQPGTRP